MHKNNNLFARLWAAIFAQKSGTSQTAPDPNPLAEKWAAARLQHTALMAENDRARQLAIATETRELYPSPDGAVYYEYAATGQIPHERFRKFKRLLTKVMFDLDPMPIHTLETELEKAIEKKDTAQGLKIMKALSSRLRADPKELALLELGAICVLRHDEDAHGYNPAIHKQKVMAAQQDSNLRFFFAHTATVALLSEGARVGALEKLQSWGLSSEEHIHEFLEKVGI